jgi:rhodanese-related sulfurtransferase
LPIWTGLVESNATLYTCRLFERPGEVWPDFDSPDTTDFSNMALFLEFLAQQWILVAALLATVVMLVLHESRKSGPSLSPQQAINMVNGSQGVFLDLRDSAEFKQGHIVDALHIPASKLAERMAELEKYRARPIILVCKMGQQAGAAGKQLKANGFEQVFKMTGGMMEWGNLQLPTITKA